MDNTELQAKVRQIGTEFAETINRLNVISVEKPNYIKRTFMNLFNPTQFQRKEAQRIHNIHLIIQAIDDFYLHIDKEIADYGVQTVQSQYGIQLKNDDIAVGVAWMKFSYDQYKQYLRKQI